MGYSLDSYVKIKSTGKISRIIFCEKILGISMYYLTNGMSCAEHQIELVTKSEFIICSMDELNVNYNKRSRDASNCLINNLFIPYFNKVEKEKQKRKKREIINFTILGLILVGFLILVTFYI
jgi:hypothetical protein